MPRIGTSPARWWSTSPHCAAIIRGIWLWCICPSTWWVAGGSRYCTTRARCGSRPGCSSSVACCSPTCRGSWLPAALPYNGSVRVPRPVPVRRGLLGVAVAAAGLAALTALLVPARASVSLSSVALLYLVPVVAAAVIGGVWPALVAAVGADLVVNFFFIPPYHTLVVASGQHVVVLVIYVLVASAVSLAVEVAARQRVRAARRGVAATLLGGAATEPVSAQSLTRLLEHVRDTFGMTAVALLQSDPDGEHPVAVVGEQPPGRPVLTATAGEGLRLAAWGPEIFAEDRATLTRLATAAARTLQAQRLADEAAAARDLAEVDRVRSALLAAVGHDLRTPLAGIKAAVSSLRHPELDLPAAARAELLATIEESTDRLDAL